MARSKKQKEKYHVRKEEDGGSDVDSEASSSPSGDDAKDKEKKVVKLNPEEQLDETLDELTESHSRATHRITALGSLIDQFVSCLPLSIIDAKRNTLLSSLCNCIRKPHSSAEGEKAARALSLMGITLGPYQDGFYDAIKSPLMKLGKNSSHEETRVECLNALTISCFVNTSDEEASLALMTYCESFFNTDTANEHCAAALSNWGILVSSLDAEYNATTLVPKWMSIFADFLDHSDLNVRIASGENIALLFEAVQRSHSTTYVAEENDILEKLRILSKENSKKNSKRDNKDQRLVFRDIHKTVSDGEEPTMSFTLCNELLEFVGWNKMKQVKALKECLGTGFQEHLSNNALLRPLLDLPEIDEGMEHNRREMSANEKRTVLSKDSSESKYRSETLRSNRRDKEDQKNAFLHGE